MLVVLHTIIHLLIALVISDLCVIVSVLKQCKNASCQHSYYRPIIYAHYCVNACGASGELTHQLAVFML